MSESCFLVGRGELSQATIEACDAIAREHGATFVHANLPGEGWRYWFAGPNEGAPWDGRRRDAVDAALAKADLIASDRPFRLRREINGGDECAECGSHFDAGPRDKRPICRKCR